MNRLATQPADDREKYCTSIGAMVMIIRSTSCQFQPNTAGSCVVCGPAVRDNPNGDGCSTDIPSEVPRVRCVLVVSASTLCVCAYPLLEKSMDDLPAALDHQRVQSFFALQLLCANIEVGSSVNQCEAQDIRTKPPGRTQERA